MIDCYSIKPIDAERSPAAARETARSSPSRPRPEGGLGERCWQRDAGGRRPPGRQLAVPEMPGSGTAAELLHGAGIDAAAIVDAVHEHAAVEAQT